MAQPLAQAWTTILLAVATACLLVVAFGLHRLLSRRNARVIRDPLTGAYTPDFLQEVYDTELRRAERTGVPFSLALVDVKAQSQAAEWSGSGEAPLALAAWLKKNLRGCDYVGRLDDHRFVVILPETWDEDARVVASRINGSFRYRQRQSDAETWLSCDVAVATWRPEAPDVWSGLLQRHQHAAVATP